MLGGQQGVALAAPPRAGKGVGVVIPNALNWPGSLVCVDIKRENWTVTAGFRAACGQAVHLFEPFAEDGRTARWNPFHYVSEDPLRRVNDLQRIADMLYPEQPERVTRRLRAAVWTHQPALPLMDEVITALASLAIDPDGQRLARMPMEEAPESVRSRVRRFRALLVELIATALHRAHEEGAIRPSNFRIVARAPIDACDAISRLPRLDAALARLFLTARVDGCRGPVARE
jgi:type IV secretory pathway TraG/TraD family ATPase VirD4